MTAKQSESQTDGNRPENPDWTPVNCHGSGDARCADLNPWGKAWEKWGRTLLKEMDEMKLAICNLEKRVYYNVNIPGGTICDARGPIEGGGGGPPTDTTQPPKPPFRP